MKAKTKDKDKTIDKLVYIPYKRKLTKLAQQNRNNPSPAEKKIWYGVLCRKQFRGYKFTRQKPIANFIVDFYCSKLQLMIEIDGDSHVKNKEYDKVRTDVLNQCGLKILRYTNRDVMNNIEGVYQDLMRFIEPPVVPFIKGDRTNQGDKTLVLAKSPDLANPVPSGIGQGFCRVSLPVLLAQPNGQGGPNRHRMTSRIVIARTRRGRSNLCSESF